MKSKISLAIAILLLVVVVIMLNSLNNIDYNDKHRTVLEQAVEYKIAVIDDYGIAKSETDVAYMQLNGYISYKDDELGYIQYRNNNKIIVDMHLLTIPDAVVKYSDCQLQPIEYKEIIINDRKIEQIVILEEKNE